MATYGFSSRYDYAYEIWWAIERPAVGMVRRLSRVRNDLIFGKMSFGNTHMQKNTTYMVCLLMAAVSVYCIPHQASAEMYVAGYGGVNFADRINSIAGTGPQAGVPGPFVDFDLKNSITYGGKIGYFP